MKRLVALRGSDDSRQPIVDLIGGEQRLATGANIGGKKTCSTRRASTDREESIGDLSASRRTRMSSHCSSSGESHILPWMYK